MGEQTYTIKPLIWDRYGSSNELCDVFVKAYEGGYSWWIDQGNREGVSEGWAPTQAEARGQGEAAYREIVAGLLVPVMEGSGDD